MREPLPLVIFGTGSLARMAHYLALCELGLEVVGFAVDSQYREDSELLNLPVFDVRLLSKLYPPGTASVFVAVGYRSIYERAKSWRRFADAGWETPTLISRTASIATTARLGENCLVMPGVVIEPGVSIQDNNIVWSNATICHDSIVGCDNFIAASATIGGQAVVGNRCFFGFSSTVLHQRTVGNDVLLAASALLTVDAPSLGRYQGIPAKRASEISAEFGICID